MTRPFRRVGTARSSSADAAVPVEEGLSEREPLLRAIGSRGGLLRAAVSGAMSSVVRFATQRGSPRPAAPAAALGSGSLLCLGETWPTPGRVT